MSEWQPIDTAPKDGTRVLLSRPGREPTCGQWEDDKYAKNPRPYWTDDNARLWGLLDTRRRAPSHWMPLPPPPPPDPPPLGMVMPEERDV